MPRRKTNIKSTTAMYNLVIAILKQAVTDYKRHPEMRAEITRFIRSEYFKKLTNIDPKKFEKLMKEKNTK